jgi:hypothetical protein
MQQFTHGRILFLLFGGSIVVQYLQWLPLWWRNDAMIGVCLTDQGAGDFVLSGSSVFVATTHGDIYYHFKRIER